MGKETYEYEYINNNNEKIIKNLFIILTKEITINLLNNEIEQFFGDATYHCIPPTVKIYKFFIISGFNMKLNKINICCYCLIPDEKFSTYNKLFSILKDTYKFNPKIFNLDFCISISKALKDNFPNCLQIKCYFHFVKCIYTKCKKSGYLNKERANKTNELIFNIKAMAFIDPKFLKKFYDKILDSFERE